MMRLVLKRRDEDGVAYKVYLLDDEGFVVGHVDYDEGWASSVEYAEAMIASDMDDS